MRGFRWIQGYYLASPIFFLFGLWWGFEVRVTFIPDAGCRFGYYLVLSGLGLLAYFRPKSAPWVALGESTINLFLIILWILLPIYTLGDVGDLRVPYTPAEVLVNGLLAGSFFVLGFYRAQGVIFERYPWLKSPRGR